VGYYARFPGNPPLSRYVAEWAPPNPLSSFSWAFFVVLLVILVAVFLAWRRGARPDPVLAGLAVLVLALALTAVRNQAWFGFGGTLLAADMAARASAGRTPVFGTAFSRTVTGLLAGLAVASMVALGVTPDSQFFRQTPRRAINVAAELAVQHPALRVLGDDYSGTALLWLRPAVTGRVGFDVRFELYGPELQTFSDFLFVRGSAWDRVVRGYGLVVASSLHPELVRKLTTLSGWRVVFEDRSGIVIIRTSRQRHVTG
jgi:hypothetical protein